MDTPELWLALALGLPLLGSPLLALLGKRVRIGMTWLVRGLTAISLVIGLGAEAFLQLAHEAAARGLDRDAYARRRCSRRSGKERRHEVARVESHHRDHVEP